MTATKLDKPKWSMYFDRMSKELLGKRAEVEVAGIPLGDQIEAIKNIVVLDGDGLEQILTLRDPLMLPGHRLEVPARAALKLDCGAELIRLEAKRALTAAVGDSSVSADQVEPVRPAAVGRSDRVVDRVHDHRHA